MNKCTLSRFLSLSLSLAKTCVPCAYRAGGGSGLMKGVKGGGPMPLETDLLWTVCFGSLRVIDQLLYTTRGIPSHRWSFGHGPPCASSAQIVAHDVVSLACTH